MSTAEKVNLRVQRMKRGAPFSISGFYSLGSRASVEKAMSRLTKKGQITRVSKGYYVRPKPLKSLPSVHISTSVEEVARAWARENNYTLVPQGLESAYRLGLQTQAPIKKIFWSNGPSRQFAIGNETIEIRHTTKKKLRWAGRPEGALFRGLSVLPPESVSLANIQKAFSRLALTLQESQKMLKKLQSTPLPMAWQNKLARFESLLAQ